jgi:hypothetical protein
LDHGYRPSYFHIYYSEAGKIGEKGCSWQPQLSLPGDNPRTYFPLSAAVIGQTTSTLLMQLTHLFHCITAALTVTNLATLKIQAVHSSETSVHLATTSCRNPKEGLLLKSNKKMNRTVTEKIW